MSEPVGTGLVSLLACYYFDLELGQKLEAVYPLNHDLSKEEERTIGFHAFPDSMSFELHVDRSAIRDSIYTFQLERNTPSTTTITTTTQIYGFVFCRQRQDDSLPRGGEQRSVVVLSPFPISSLLLPFTQHAGCTLLASSSRNLSAVLESLWQEQAYNLQPIHPGDPLDAPLWGARVSLALGGNLQPYTNTIITDLPELSTLPPHCAAAAAAAFASKDTRNRGGLDELVDELDDDTGLPLPLIPLNNNQENHHGKRNNSFSQDESLSSSLAASVMGGFAELDVYTPMSHALHHLWTVWELLMVGQPLMVVSPSPSSASFTVAALSSLIAPLPYTQPQRPYFTIHDPAFAPLVAAAKRGELPLQPYSSGNDVSSTSSGAQLPMLIGVTNQFIIKSLLGWGNIIGTGYSLSSTGLSVAQSGSGTSTNSSGESGSSTTNNGSSSRSGRGLVKWRRGGGGPGSLVSSPSDGAWFDYRPLTRPDKELLASLVQVTAISDGISSRNDNSGGMENGVDAVAKKKRAAALNSATIKRHFQELTRAVLFPLLPLISPVPPSMAASPYQLANPPNLPVFDPQEILDGLKGRSARVPDILLQRFGSQKSVVSFYARFLKSPIFTIWLQARQAAAAEWQRLVWRAAWRAAGGPSAAVGLPGGQEDVGAIEEFFSLEQRLGGDTNRNDTKDDALVAELRILFEKLPTDLQNSLILNPKRRLLLLEEKEGGGERE